MNEEIRFGVNNDILYFAGKDETVKIPTKNDEDAGYDIYAHFEEDEFVIPPHNTKLVPTGLYYACHPNYFIRIVERSSNTKWHGRVCAGVIDSGFRGEIFIGIYNSSHNTIIIDKNHTEIQFNDDSKVIYFPYNKAIAQLLVLPVPKMNVQTIPLDELKEIPSIRGDGELGSSGK